MYCRRCGKFINNDASVCNECVEEMLKNEQKATVTEQKEEIKEEQNTQVQTIANTATQVEPEAQVLTVVSNSTEVVPETQVVYQYAPRVQKKSNVGLTRAIWSVVLSVAAFMAFMFIAMRLSNVDVYASSIGFSLILFAFPECILGVIFGAKSIVASNRIAKQTGVRPKATLICGIIGLALSCYFMMIFTFTLGLL